MAAMIHVWVTRAYCPTCENYFWTNPGSGNVRCRCGVSRIEDHAVVVGDPIPSSYYFRQAVIADIGVPSADLDLVQGTA